jgi:hypothetical protein
MGLDSGGMDFDALKAELSAFAHTKDGLLLQEAAALIAEQKANGQGVGNEPPGTNGGVHAEFDGWSCAANVLNGVAAGAARLRVGRRSYTAARAAWHGTVRRSSASLRTATS